MSLTKIATKVEPGEEICIGDIYTSIYDSVIDTKIITLTISDQKKNKYAAFGIMISINKDVVDYSIFSHTPSQHGEHLLKRRKFDFRFEIDSTKTVVRVMVKNNSKRQLLSIMDQ